MTALTAGVNRVRRGPPAPGAFGYSVAAGAVVFKGGIVAVTSAGALQPAGVAGSATHANINATVYASDDNTLTLTAGTLVAAGTLVGIEGGKTYVRIIGS